MNSSSYVFFINNPAPNPKYNNFGPTTLRDTTILTQQLFPPPQNWLFGTDLNSQC